MYKRQILDNGGYPNPLGSISRIEWLVERCPKVEADLLYQLATLSTQSARWWKAKHGTDSPNNWAKNSVERLEAFLERTAVEPEGYSTRRRISGEWLIEMKELAASVPGDDG